MKIQFRAVDLALARFGFSHTATYTPCDYDCEPVQAIFVYAKIWLRSPNPKYGWYAAHPSEVEVIS